MIPVLAYQAQVSPAARLVLCRLWDFAHPSNVAGVFFGYIYKIQLVTDLRMSAGSVDRCIRELTGTPWLISFAQYDETGKQLFELYTGEEGCFNG